MQLKVNVLGSVLLASGAVALAQAPQPAVATGQTATDTDQGAGSGGLQEVVVAANKRRENIQDVPIAISAITESDLAAHGVQDTLDAGAVGSTAAESVGPQPDQSGSADVMSEANNPGGYDEEIDLPPRTYGLRVEYTF
jgi:outer membrane receptor protein involved in Fe transport